MLLRSGWMPGSMRFEALLVKTGVIQFLHLSVWVLSDRRNGLSAVASPWWPHSANWLINGIARVLRLVGHSLPATAGRLSHHQLPLSAGDLPERYPGPQ